MMDVVEIAQNELLPLTNIATPIAAPFPFFSGDYSWRHLHYWCDWLISWLKNVVQVSVRFPGPIIAL